MVWRDAVTAWFQQISGIPDKLGRVGHYPDRIEAESMQSDGYTPVEVTPWETASGGKAVVCNRAARCTLLPNLDGRLALTTLRCNISICAPALRNTSCCSMASPWRIGSRMQRFRLPRLIRISMAAPAHASPCLIFASSRAIRSLCAERRTRANQLRWITSKLNNNRALALPFPFACPIERTADPSAALLMTQAGVRVRNNRHSSGG